MWRGLSSAVVFQPESGRRSRPVAEGVTLLGLNECFRECGHENDVAEAVVGLWWRFAHRRSSALRTADDLILEVDVPPVESQKFALAKPGQGRRREERPVTGWRGGRQAADLVRIEHGLLLSRDPRTLAPVKLGDRVELDQFSAYCVVEQSRKRDQDRVDRGAGVAPPAKAGDQLQDLIDSDLVESMTTEERKDVSVETAGVILERAGPD